MTSISSRALRVLLLPSLVATLLGACGGDVDEPIEPPANCDELSAIDLVGEWHITGQGTMSDCLSVRGNGDLELEVKPLAVYAMVAEDGSALVTTDNEPDAFYQRIARSGVTLTASDVPKGVTFSGAGLTCSVTFMLSDVPEDEEGPRAAEAQYYTFTGYMQNLQSIKGTFIGRGPGPCSAKGRFEVSAR
jgi:hypothetical protein